jgi:hypothetical protein
MVAARVHRMLRTNLCAAVPCNGHWPTWLHMSFAMQRDCLLRHSSAAAVPCGCHWPTHVCASAATAAQQLRCCLQIYGPESSGKTTLALHAIAEVQKKGGIACFVDAEHAFDPEYAQVGAGATCVCVRGGESPCVLPPVL